MNKKTKQKKNQNYEMFVADFLFNILKEHKW